MLSDISGAEAASNADTSLLYTGEQYDSALSQYYLRARYYNPSNGLFNRIDPYAGNTHDPQSLHKYLYCHANPINGIDPSGMIFIAPGIIKLIIALGVVKAVQLLIGIRVAYVLGAAYIEEVGRGNIVAINKQIGRLSDPDIHLLDWILKFRLRPDIVDHTLQSVYEVKPDNHAKIVEGMRKNLEYIAVLNERYPGRMYTPGTWQPRRLYYYVPGLPGITGLEGIRIQARNAKGGVIAYKYNENDLRRLCNRIIMGLAITFIIAGINTEVARVRMLPGYVTTRGLLGRGFI